MFQVLVFWLLAVFAVNISAATPIKQADIVGTWRFISVDGRPVKPFFIRMYPNEKSASWPAPHNWNSATVRGVSYGRTYLQGEYFIIDAGYGKFNPKCRIELKGDEMILTNTDVTDSFTIESFQTLNLVS